MSDAMKHKARRRLCRHVAAVLVQLMSDTDTSFTTIEKRLGWPSGKAKRFINRLMDGDGSIALNPIAEFAFAMGATLRPHAYSLPEGETYTAAGPAPKGTLND